MSYYDNNWFKGSRLLLQECIEEGHALDFLVMDIILSRVRYNGNRQDLELGECFIGLREIGKIIGKDDKFVKRCIERLTSKCLIRAAHTPHVGSTIKVLDALAFRNDAQAMPKERPTNVDSTKTETRQDREHIHCVFTLELRNRAKEQYPKRLGVVTWANGFARLEKQKADPELFLKACEKYRASCEINGTVGTQFVKNFETFCTKGNWEEWVDAAVVQTNKPGWD